MGAGLHCGELDFEVGLVGPSVGEVDAVGRVDVYVHGLWGGGLGASWPMEFYGSKGQHSKRSMISSIFDDKLRARPTSE